MHLQAAVAGGAASVQVTPTWKSRSPSCSLMLGVATLLYTALGLGLQVTMATADRVLSPPIAEAGFDAHSACTVDGGANASCTDSAFANLRLTTIDAVIWPSIPPCDLTADDAISMPLIRRLDAVTNFAGSPRNVQLFASTGATI